MTHSNQWTGLSDSEGHGETHNGRPDLRAAKAPWTAASAVAKGLHASATVSVTGLNAATAGGATTSAQGLACTAVLDDLRTSWTERLTAVRDECSRLAGALEKAGKEFGEQDVRTKQRFDSLGCPK